MQEQELFQRYELKGWQLSPYLYKIIGASALINLVAFFLLAQSNFLTGKTCDSPIASGVCSVLDALYVGSALAGTDTEFDSKDYQKTELEDADITFVKYIEPFKYPEGYFANSDQTAEIIDPTLIPPTDMNGFPNVNQTVPGATDLSATKPIVPTPNINPFTGNLPKSITGGNYTTTNKIKKNRQKNNPMNDVSPNTLDGDKTAENKDKTNQDQTVAESEPVKAIDINRKPFEDLGDSINEKLERTEVDLSKPFFVNMDGTIMADGRLDRNKSKYIKFEGDEQMIQVAKDAIEAIGDSGFLGYLKVQGIDKANLTLKQDDQQIYILLISDQKDANKANTTASAFNTMLSGLIFGDKNNIKKLDDNSRLLVNNAKVTSDGRNFVLNVTIPKQDAQNMIKKSLNDRAEKKAKKLNSNGEVNNNTSEKSGK